MKIYRVTLRDTTMITDSQLVITVPELCKIPPANDHSYHCSRASDPSYTAAKSLNGKSASWLFRDLACI